MKPKYGTWSCRGQGEASELGEAVRPFRHSCAVAPLAALQIQNSKE
jgi:hypothetical protein